MSFAQKDRLNRIQHTFLTTTEKNFHRKRMKNDEIRAFFEPQILIEQPNIKNRIFWLIKNFRKENPTRQFR